MWLESGKSYRIAISFAETEIGLPCQPQDAFKITSMNRPAPQCVSGISPLARPPQAAFQQAFREYRHGAFFRSA
jgi:hypothetical protein